MTDETRALLLRQFDTAWKLLEFHLADLGTEECLWRPGSSGLHVYSNGDGTWRADWPDRESYDIGPPSIAWITWHIVFWWSMVLDHSFGPASLSRERVAWPGTVDEVRTTIDRLRRQWLAALDQLDDLELASTARTRWPFAGRPFTDVVAWLNIELTKNAAEIGFARFLHGSHRGNHGQKQA